MTRTRVRFDRLAALLGALLLALVLLTRGGAEASAPARPYLVKPGDTLWAIARAEVGPEGDPRPVVAEIRDANHLPGASLIAGETIRLP